MTLSLMERGKESTDGVHAIIVWHHSTVRGFIGIGRGAEGTIAPTFQSVLTEPPSTTIVCSLYVFMCACSFCCIICESKLDIEIRPQKCTDDSIGYTPRLLYYRTQQRTYTRLHIVLKKLIFGIET